MSQIPEKDTVLFDTVYEKNIINSKDCPLWHMVRYIDKICPKKTRQWTKIKDLGGSVLCELSRARGNDIGCTHPDLDMSVTTGLHQEY